MLEIKETGLQFEHFSLEPFLNIYKILLVFEIEGNILEATDELSKNAS